MKTITINIPDDCEVQIIKKKEEGKWPVIKTYQDLINSEVRGKGFYIDNTFGDDVKISKDDDALIALCNKDMAASEKVAKSMLAMAMISQLMPYYGGAITDDEWKETCWTSKYTISKNNNKIEADSWSTKYHFLAFHTSKQRDEFLKYNEQLVKDYLMID